MKILAVLGYTSGIIIYQYNILHLPVLLIPAGLTILSVFDTPVSNYVLNWSFYSIIVYMLITYHEHDVCIIEKCVEETDGLDQRSMINIISTLVAWASVPDTPRKVNIKETSNMPVRVKRVEPVVRRPRPQREQPQKDWSKVRFNFTV